jgi:hypothetical protein
MSETPKGLAKPLSRRTKHHSERGGVGEMSVEAVLYTVNGRGLQP